MLIIRETNNTEYFVDKRERMKNIILKNVPTTVLAADADIEELRKMLEGDSTLVLNDDGTVGEKGKQNRIANRAGVGYNVGKSLPERERSDAE